jgi:predicted nicotinamide N-methyase
MKRVVHAAAAATLVAVLSACAGSDEPTLTDVPKDIRDARPTITLEEAKFVLAARALGVDVTGSSVSEDIETAKTVCWALKEGDVQVKDIAGELTEDDALRTKRIMKAGIQTLCPDFDDQVKQLDLPE